MCSFAWTLQAIYRHIAQLAEHGADNAGVSGSIPLMPTKCSFNNRGLEQVTSVKINPIRFIVRLRRKNCKEGTCSGGIRTCP